MVSVTYALPAATAAKRGGIEVGSGLTITGDVLSVPAASPSGLVQIQQVAVTTPTAASIAFTSIPATYSNLMVIWKARGDAGEVDLLLQFNGDTTANYDWTGWVTSQVGATAQTSIKLAGGVIASTALAGAFAAGTFHIIDYTSATTMKQIEGNFWRVDPAFSVVPSLHSGNWRNVSAAISSLTLTPSSGNLVTGSIATLYGMT